MEEPSQITQKITILKIKKPQNTHKKSEKIEEKTQKMAKSKYEYVKQFESSTIALPQTYMVVRLDGRGFTKMCDLHKFEKPNDLKALEVMNQAAKDVLSNFHDIFIAYGQSDEFSFAFTKDSDLFERRTDKIVSCLVSLFTASYCMNFEKIYGKPLKTIPSFDGRLVCYPSEAVLVDYFSWRQVDCHINNMYNTCFWLLVKSGIENKKAEEMLKGTLSSDKNELMFTKFGINYNKVEPRFRKGSIVMRVWRADEDKVRKYEQILAAGGVVKKSDGTEVVVKPPRKKQRVVESFEDLIKPRFWVENFGGDFRLLMKDSKAKGKGEGIKEEIKEN